MKKLYSDYIHGTEKQRADIEAMLKTEAFKHKRRKLEDKLRKDAIVFLRAAAALDLKQLG